MTKPSEELRSAMPEETKPVEREAFEEWYRREFPGRRQPEWFPQDRRYFYGQANDAWEVWQASAAAALERVLEYIPTVTGPTGGWLVSPKTVANEVEALKGSC